MSSGADREDDSVRILEARTIDGPNVDGWFPVVVARLDLGPSAERTTRDLAGFSDRLVEALPGLADHHCGLGRPGGLLERLAEGTLLGHVVEHVALELQTRAGCAVFYGKTRQERGSVYRVVFEHECGEAGLAALEAAVRLVCDLRDGSPVDPEGDVESLRAVLAERGLGPSTRAIIRAARARGIPVRWMGEGSWVQLGCGRHQRRIRAAVTSRTPALAVDLAGDKTMTKRLLRAGGLAVPEGTVAASAAEAVAAARHLGFPLAVKPVDGNHGRGVTLRIESIAEVRAAFRLARQHADRAIIERYVRGRQYRVLVVGGQVVAAAERLPAQVVGDGVRSIAELVVATNRDPLRGLAHERPLTRIRLDDAAAALLARHGLSAASVPAPGEAVLLTEAANLSTGGTAADVTADIHPTVVEACRRAAALLGLDVAGVDLVIEDIAAPLRDGGWAVIEVNASPGLRMHLHPSAGQARDVAGAIVDWLYPPGAAHSVPVIAVTGTNGKTTTARLAAAALAAAGLSVGLTSTEGVWVGGREMRAGDCAGPESAADLLSDPEIDAAVLETARGGLLRGGLGFERCDVAVVTNLSADHLGQGGVDTLAELAHVKSLVVEAVAPDGFAVLNAQDPWVAGMASRCRGRVALFGLRGEYPLLRAHMAAGGVAAFVRDGALLHFDGHAEHPLCRVADLALGSAPYNLQNALAGALAALCAGVPAPVVSGVLARFGRDLPNPGRFELREVHGVTVVMDYGHNPRGMASALVAARRRCRGRLIAVLGVPGDRRDDLILAAGRTAALCDAVVVREDADLRGRKPGEVAALLMLGAEKARVARGCVGVVLDEAEAVRHALSQAVPGDTVVAFFERRAAVEAALAAAATASTPAEVTAGG
jgi:cyanophycin synthetase